MGNARKPHRDQRKLNQDPTYLAKEEDKRLVKAVSYADVVAYCEERADDVHQRKASGITACKSSRSSSSAAVRSALCRSRKRWLQRRSENCGQ